MNETRFPCRAHLRLQAKTVSLAMCMHIETPATPQTTFISDPFSAKRKLQSSQRKVNVKSNGEFSNRFACCDDWLCKAL
jgi:hypothetical protein